MMLILRPIWTSAAAAVALLGTVALVGAQQTPDQSREPSVRDRGSDSKASREPPGAQQRPGTKGAERPDQEKAKGAERSDKDRAKGAERPDEEKPKGAERSDKDRAKGAERADQEKAKGAERSGKDRTKGAERADQEKAKGAERSDKDRTKGAERTEQEKAKGAEQPDATRPSTAQPDIGKGAPGRAQLSEQQRTEIGAKLRQTRVERTRVQVSVNIGSRVPASVRLHPLPNAILVSAPSYRGHSYFVQQDGAIVIVDARSHVVVDVLPASTRAARLSLSPEQMRFIYATVPKDRTANIRVRLALGAEVPARVELLRFPAEVRRQIPEVEGYRYVVAGRDVVIVHPRDREIALVISE